MRVAVIIMSPAICIDEPTDASHCARVRHGVGSARNQQVVASSKGQKTSDVSGKRAAGARRVRTENFSQPRMLGASNLRSGAEGGKTGQRAEHGA